jgi:hypothetical protein
MFHHGAGTPHPGRPVLFQREDVGIDAYGPAHLILQYLHQPTPATPHVEEDGIRAGVLAGQTFIDLPALLPALMLCPVTPPELILAA